LRHYRWARRSTAIGAWLALGFVLAGWLALGAGDAWGPSTFIMFGPRWLLAVPALVVLPAALTCWRLLWPIGSALFPVAGPLMGFNLPWDRLRSSPEGGLRMRVLTCNAHFARIDSAALDDWVVDVRPDVVALQEWRTSNRADALTEPGWHVHRKAGLLLASRYPIRGAEVIGDHADGDPGKWVRYELETPAGVVTVASLHLASPRNEFKQVAVQSDEGVYSPSGGGTINNTGTAIVTKTAGTLPLTATPRPEMGILELVTVRRRRDPGIAAPDPSAIVRRVDSDGCRRDAPGSRSHRRSFGRPAAGLAGRGAGIRPLPRLRASASPAIGRSGLRSADCSG
jgi:hypothetical protein